MLWYLPLAADDGRLCCHKPHQRSTAQYGDTVCDIWPNPSILPFTMSGEGADPSHASWVTGSGKPWPTCMGYMNDVA